MITGRVYLLRGEQVTVTCAWNGRSTDLPTQLPHVTTRRFAPRNVQIQRPDGSRAVRPFRGLLVPPPHPRA
jgi:hypothetical protein